MKWKNKLTKKELTHLKETKITTFAAIRGQAAHLETQRFPCWECVGICRKLEIPVKLTAFHNR